MVCTLFDHHCSPISAKNLSVIVKIYFNTSSLWTNLWTNSTSRPRRTFCSSRTLRKTGPFSVNKDSWSSSLILLKQSEVKKWQHRQCPGNTFFYLEIVGYIVTKLSCYPGQTCVQPLPPPRKKSGEISFPNIFLRGGGCFTYATQAPSPSKDS